MAGAIGSSASWSASGPTTMASADRRGPALAALRLNEGDHALRRQPSFCCPPGERSHSPEGANAKCARALHKTSLVRRDTRFSRSKAVLRPVIPLEAPGRLPLPTWAFLTRLFTVQGTQPIFDKIDRPACQRNPCLP